MLASHILELVSDLGLYPNSTTNFLCNLVITTPFSAWLQKSFDSSPLPTPHPLIGTIFSLTPTHPPTLGKSFFLLFSLSSMINPFLVYVLSCLALYSFIIFEPLPWSHLTPCLLWACTWAPGLLEDPLAASPTYFHAVARVTFTLVTLPFKTLQWLIAFS